MRYEFTVHINGHIDLDNESTYEDASVKLFEMLDMPSELNVKSLGFHITPALDRNNDKTGQ